MTIHSKKYASLTPLHLCDCIVRQLESKGIPLEDTILGSGLRSDDFNIPSRMLDLQQEQQIIRNALRLSDDPLLGLNLGRSARISAYGLLGYAMLTAPTLRAGLEIPMRLPALLGTYFQLGIYSSDGMVQIRAENCRAPADLEPILTELCLVSFKTLIEDMLLRSVSLMGVAFRYGPLCELDIYESAFGCDVYFDADVSSISLDAKLLDEILPLANSLCHQKVIDLCQNQNRELVSNREWLEKLRNILSENLVNPPDLESLAEKMHCSPRTLRRQLQDQNTSYRQLLDELRFTKAKSLLGSHSGTVDQIAEELGFSDGAGLRRAFRRWCGMSPNAFRT
ncbi:AraC family transcriptional regulator [Pseudomonas ogarae]|uniref:AraC family transcriptional regulator n=1 Tax=Pseudomonas ogarae (strain DSM 112162 / CECT 30235 / F113) TaxID=1114970 RepID=UPI0015918DF6|nr:AraC family transcriptional regulator [Pseudomonas ogarae]